MAEAWLKTTMKKRLSDSNVTKLMAEICNIQKKSKK